LFFHLNAVAFLFVCFFWLPHTAVFINMPICFGCPIA
jgi:hypothetical protein